MMFFRNLSPDRDADNPAGGAAGTGADGANKDAGSGAGNSAGGAAGGDDKGKLTPEQQITELTTKLTGLTTENADLKSKYGKQTEQVGRMNKIAGALTSKDLEERKRILLGLAKTAGFNELFFEKPAAGAAAAAAAGEAPKFDMEAFKKEMNAEMQSFFNPVQENLLATRYDDWDSLTDQRADLAMAMGTKDVTQPELLHFAARGRALPQILEAHKKTVIDEYNAELTKKNQGQISDGGGAGSGKISTKKSVEKLEEALSAGLL
jgi:hypothetical protein